MSSPVPPNLVDKQNRASAFPGGFSRQLTRSRYWLVIGALLAVVVFAQVNRSLAFSPASTEPQAAETVQENHTPLLAEEKKGHSDPVAPLLLAIILILLLAKLGGDLFERMHMPAVLGELVVGVLLGNLALFTGWHGLDFFQPPPLHEPGNPYSVGAALKMLAGIGAVLLLFEVGLESNVRKMLSVGTSSLLVAILGVIAPIVLGWLVGWYLIPETGWQTHAFIGATLCATSVGITARVLQDLGRSQQRESQIILGAAVIDDVLGLIVLAVVSGVIVQGTVNAWEILKIIGLAFGFLAVSIVFGATVFTRPLFKAANFLRGRGLLVAASLVICFGFAWLATQVGLAAIIGAFAAGLILQRAHYRELGAREQKDLEEAIAPLSALLVPVFFVNMGVQVDLRSFQDPKIWGLAAALTIMAIVGKQLCSLGVREKGMNKWAVGLGMIPRGEVGLIFAAQGIVLGVINPGVYSAIVVMVMITTMVTPPLLKWSLQQGEKPQVPFQQSEPPQTETEKVEART